jgi:hypothetical protein
LVFSTFAALFVLHAVCLYAFERGYATPNPPWFGEHYRPIAGFCLASWCVLGLFVMQRMVRAWMPRPGPLLGWAGRGLLAGLIILSGLVFFHGSKLARPTQHHFNDTFHYALGAKYYAELGHVHLYRCVIQAVDKDVIPDSAKARWLEDYSMTTAGIYRRTEPDCQARFSPARWGAFQRDLQTFQVPFAERKRLRNSIQDHGYNGTPAHAFVASHATGSRTLTPDFLLGCTLFDVGLICIGLSIVVCVFGWEWGGFVALFYFTNFVDRNDVVGSSFMRQMWMFGLIAGLCALQRRRPATGAALLVVSTAFNVFPFVFWFGAAVQASWKCLKVRRLTPWARRFALGTALSAAVLLPLGAAHGNGVGNYIAFAQNMATHTGDPQLADGRAGIRQSSFGIGLRYLFIQDKRWNKHGEHVKVGRHGRLTKYQRIRWLHYGVGGVLLLASVWLARRMTAVEAALLVGFTAMFSLLDTAFYYFTWTSLLPLVLARERIPDMGRAIMIGMLALSAAANTYRYLPNFKSAPLHNDVATIGYLVLLLLSLAYFAVPRRVSGSAA